MTQTSTDTAKSVGHRMATGAVWLVALRFATRALGVISLLIVARLLLPEDYGLIALATTLAALLETASDFGAELLVIKERSATRDDYDTAYTIQLIKCLFDGLILAALAVPLAILFEDPRLEPLIYCCAVAAVFQGARNIGVLDFRKNLEIHKEFIFQFSGKIAQFIVAVVLAYIFRSYWALMAGILSQRIVMFFVSYIMSPYRPRLSLVHWRKFFNFTKWIAVNNLLMFGRDRLDTLMVGKFLGPTSLGQYQLAHEIANLPTTDLVGPVTRALFPGYSMIANDRSKLADSFISSLATLLLMTLPIGLGLGLIGEPLVALMFGESWQPAAPLITALAIFGVIRTGYANSGALYLALGRIRIEPALMAIYIVIVAPLIYGLLPVYGPIGAAYALIIAAAINLLLNTAVVLRLLQIPFSRLFGQIWRSVAASLFMTLCIVLVMPQASHPIAMILLALVSGFVSYLACLWLCWRLSGQPEGPEKQIAGYLMSVLQARQASRVEPLKDQG